MYFSTAQSRYAKYVGLFFVGLLETIAKMIVLSLIAVEIILGNIDYDSVIDVISGNDWTMYFSCRNENNVIFAELIGTSFHTIAQISIQTNENLMEVMVMERDINTFLISDVKDFEVFMQISSLFIFRFHERASLT